jgi:predicted acyl esterase
MKQVGEAFVLLAGLMWSGPAAAAAPSAADRDVQLNWTQIPLRDGVLLGATVFLPKEPARAVIVHLDSYALWNRPPNPRRAIPIGSTTGV